MKMIFAFFREKTGYLFLFFLAMQVSLCLMTKSIKPKFEITPYPPTQNQIKALSLGDEQFYYRYLSFILQFAGTQIGHTSKFKDYNYEFLYYWFKALTDMDKKSTLMPTLAANYYGAVRDKERLYWVAKYLVEAGESNPEFYWRGLTYAAYIASTALKDKDLVVKAATPLATVKSKDVPLWAKSIGLFYLASEKNKYGLNDPCESLKLVMLIDKEVISNKNELKKFAKDSVFESIVKQRINNVKANIKDIKNCNLSS